MGGDEARTPGHENQFIGYHIVSLVLAMHCLIIIILNFIPVVASGGAHTSMVLGVQFMSTVMYVPVPY